MATYKQTFTITATDSTIPVTQILSHSTGSATITSGTSPTIDMSLYISILPTNATYQTVIFEMMDANGTGATITSAGVLTLCAAGTVQFRAYIKNGAGVNRDIQQVYTMTVTESHAYLIVNDDGGVWFDCKSDTGKVDSESKIYTVDTLGITNPVIPEYVNGIKVRYIGIYALSNNTSVKSVTIEADIETIASCAFLGCTKLTSINIPSNTTVIGSYAFYNCTTLPSISIPSKVTTINERAFRSCESLLTVTIPSSVTLIDEYAFAGNYKLKTLTISGGAYIGLAAFWECTALTTITLNSSITVIDDSAFRDCASMQSISLPSSLTTIGDHSFYGCESLQTITLPSKLLTVGECAFRQCSSLMSMESDSSTITYAPGTFQECGKLVTVTYGITSNIPEWCFYECSSLSSFTATTNSGTLVVGEGAFMNCKALSTYSISNSTDIVYSKNAMRASGVSGPRKIGGVIGELAFAECEALTAVTLNPSVTSIGSQSFGVDAGQSGLISSFNTSSATKLTTIGYRAFINQFKLTSIDVPASVTSIDSEAFHNCGLTTITVNAKSGAISGSPWGATNATVTWNG